MAGTCYWTQIVVEEAGDPDLMDQVIEHLAERGVTPHAVRFLNGYPLCAMILLPPGLEAEAAMIALLFDAVVSPAYALNETPP